VQLEIWSHVSRKELSVQRVQGEAAAYLHALKELSLRSDNSQSVLKLRFQAMQQLVEEILIVPHIDFQIGSAIHAFYELEVLLDAAFEHLSAHHRLIYGQQKLLEHGHFRGVDSEGGRIRSRIRHHYLILGPGVAKEVVLRDDTIDSDKNR
jgi:hypothetical protein